LNIRAWKSPDGDVFNQADHILIDARHCSDLMDVRSYRGANIDSDQYFITSKLEVKYLMQGRCMDFRLRSLTVENWQNKEL
jgi:hypothetical protein